MQCNRMQQLVLLPSPLLNVACENSMLAGTSTWKSDMHILGPQHTQLAETLGM